MTKTIWTAACASTVACATAALIAQAAPSQQTTTSTTDRRIIVTGCLTQAPARSGDAAAEPAGAAAPTAGTARVSDSVTGDAAIPVPTFLVIAATASPADAASGAATETAAGTSAARTYRVIGNPALLREHVGEKVEVTGTLEEQKGPATASADAAVRSEGRVPVVRLQSGKTVAASCSQIARAFPR